VSQGHSAVHTRSLCTYALMPAVNTRARDARSRLAHAQGQEKKLQTELDQAISDANEMVGRDNWFDWHAWTRSVCL